MSRAPTTEQVTRILRRATKNRRNSEGKILKVKSELFKSFKRILKCCATPRLKTMGPSKAKRSSRDSSKATSSGRSSRTSRHSQSDQSGHRHRSLPGRPSGRREESECRSQDYKSDSGRKAKDSRSKDQGRSGLNSGKVDSNFANSSAVRDASFPDTISPIIDRQTGKRDKTSSSKGAKPSAASRRPTSRDPSSSSSSSDSTTMDSSSESSSSTPSPEKTRKRKGRDYSDPSILARNQKIPDVNTSDVNTSDAKSTDKSKKPTANPPDPTVIPPAQGQDQGMVLNQTPNQNKNSPVKDGPPDRVRRPARRAGQKRNPNYKGPQAETYASVARPRPIPPWGDKEIRLTSADSNIHLLKNKWVEFEPLIMKGFGEFLEDYQSIDSNIRPVCILRIYYDTDVRCRVIEVGAEASAEKLRDLLIPRLELPLKLKAAIKSDSQTPIVRCFVPNIYNTYSEEQYLKFLVWANPIMIGQPLEVHRVDRRDVGRALFLQTSSTVVEYIKQNNYVLTHGFGRTQFDKKIDYISTTSVTTKDPPASLPVAKPTNPTDALTDALKDASLAEQHDAREGEGEKDDVDKFREFLDDFASDMPDQNRSGSSQGSGMRLANPLEVEGLIPMEQDDNPLREEVKKRKARKTRPTASGTAADSTSPSKI